MSLGLPFRLLLLYAIGLHLHILHHEGPTIDYAAVLAGAFASWAGVPGPGEPLLIAAGIFAAKHKLDLSPVVFWAWMGANAGGIAGWVVGRIAGRGVVTAPGPLRRLRLNAVAKGDAVFRRFAVIAILLAPSWISGIHRVRPAVYLPTNAFGAALWAGGIGVGAYFAGPPVVDLVNDVGLAIGIALVVLIVGGAGIEMTRRRRARAGDANASERLPD